MKTIISLLILIALSLQANENKQESLKLKEKNDKVLVLGSLMWQDEPYTYFEMLARHEKRNYEKVQTWRGAIRYCKTLSLAGYSDWRLPSKSEMLSIVDKSRRPTIKQEFKNVLATFYWSSTPHEKLSSDAWFVRFGNGITNSTYKIRSHYVRCIRDVE